MVQTQSAYRVNHAQYQNKLRYPHVRAAGRGLPTVVTMKEYLTTLDMAIWVGLIAAQIVLAFTVLKRHLFRRLPCFSLYVLISVLESIVLLVIAFRASYATYYDAFYIAGHFVAAIGFVTLIEFGWHVLPSLNLPQKEKALACLVGAVISIIAFVYFWPLRSIGNEKRIEVAACLVIAVTCAFIAGYSRYLGLRWSRLLGGVAFTLGLVYLIDGVTKALIGHYPLSLAVRLRQARELGNVLAVVAWIVVVASPWGEYPLTDDMLRKAEEIVGGAEASLRDFALEGSTKA